MASEEVLSASKWVGTGPDGVMSDTKYCEVLKRAGSGWKRSSKGSAHKNAEKGVRKNKPVRGNSYMRLYH